MRRRRARLRLAFARALAGAAATAWAVVGCEPEIATDPLPAAMEFDPSGRVPEPNLLAIDPATGLIDMERAGVQVPPDCAAVPASAVADCEFNTWLESLDGFPTVSPTRAPAEAALDPATLAVPADVVVLDLSGPTVVTDVAVTFDAEERWLEVVPAGGGWEPGRTYAVAVRGYADGVRTTDGREVVAAVLTYLVAADESLTCGAAEAAAIESDCPFYVLLAADLPDAEVRDALLLLEEHRTQLLARAVWTALADPGGLPREEVAALWVFPTHSGSVVELDPTRGLVPQVRGARELRLPLRGPVDAATVRPYTLAGGAGSGSVFLLDLTRLEAEDFAGGVPAFTAAVEDGALVLRADADLTPGHTIGVLVTDAVTSPAGRPLVPSPVTVLLRASGPLVDAEGHSAVTGVSAADAAELEAGRSDLALLLDNPLFAQLTGLDREDLVYVYAFDLAPAAGSSEVQP